jgi:hypothetical protein
VDALSERDLATQDYIGGIFEDSPTFNAFIITSRSEPRLDVTELTTLFPMLLDAKLIVPFIVDYLDLTQKLYKMVSFEIHSPLVQGHGTFEVANVQWT